MNKEEEEMDWRSYSASRRTVNGRNIRELSAISVSSEQRVRLGCVFILIMYYHRIFQCNFII